MCLKYNEALEKKNNQQKYENKSVKKWEKAKVIQEYSCIIKRNIHTTIKLIQQFTRTT